MRCSANTSALTLDLVQDYIGDLEEAAEDTTAGRRGTSVSDLADVVADLKKGFTELQTRAKDSDDRIAELTGDLKKGLADVASDMDLLRQSVLFHARFAGSGFFLRARKVNNGQPLIFDAITTNEGNSYDDMTGVFTVPLAGTYLFLGSVEGCESDKSVSVSLTVDGGDRSAWTCCTDRSVGSCHAVLKLKVGQKVCLKSEGDYRFHSSKCCFSGVLIQATV